MSKFPPLLLFFLALSIQATAQKDSLSKYTDEMLLEKAQETNLNGNNKSLEYCNELLKRKPANLEIYSYAHYELGMYYNDFENNDEKYIYCLQKSAYYIEKAEKYEFLNFVYVQLASFYVGKNNYEKVFFYIDKIKKNKKSSNIDTSLAKIYYLFGDFKKSIAIDLRTIREQNQKTEQYVPTSFYQLVTAYNYSKKLDSASFYLKEYKEYCKKNNTPTLYDGLWDAEVQNFILRDQYDKGIERIRQSKKYIDAAATDTYLANYYFSLCYLKKKEFRKSLEHAETALKNKVVILSFTNFELEFYMIASENAQKLGLTEKENFYLKKYSEGAQKINYQAKADFLAKLYKTDIISPLNEQLTEKKKTTDLYSIIIIVIGLVAVAAIAFAVSKSKRDKKKFLAIIARLEQEEISRQELVKSEEFEEEIREIESEQNAEIKKSVLSTMSDEADKRIAKRLDSFERRQLFLSPNISLSSMSKDFSTNAAYLSAAIKKHRNNNFNGYINDLRIDYIILKLKNNPEYFNYKIAYLAEESGFASYAVFHRAFMQRAGFSPSKFISYLKAEEKQ
ncbi:helix-turn-helix domain-containing protein [uncultured Flavobacterium sp.]|uniref:helix-turn-helix domain-containing protein n=1 Tax=uncultured Flavobacterium sp. TaxID=165435 RepID=UPI0025CFB608|nr:helix-turn-helix domain-containing protein [uncultured Flavobacterium sp.]